MSVDMLKKQELWKNDEKRREKYIVNECLKGGQIQPETRV